MKQITFLLLAATFMMCNSQVKTPQPSPLAMNEQIVGLTKVVIKYSRPSMKGRTIFGGLVPYGKIWRTGANANTTISFDSSVNIAGQKIEAGTYAIYTKPQKDTWEIFLYSKNDNWGVPRNFNNKLVVASFSAPVQKLNENIQSFTIQITDLTNNDAHVVMEWEKTRVAFRVEVPTRDKALSSISETMSKNPTQDDYYNAAAYFLNEKHELNKAKKWIAKAIEKKGDAYWYYRQQALILAELKEKKAAIKAAKKSLELAKKAGNDSYVKMNSESIDAWTASL